MIAVVGGTMGGTYKHPSKNSTMVDALFFLDIWTCAMAGSGAKRVIALKKTCSEPMMMHDFLLCSSHLPGGWHMLIHPASDQMYHMAMSTMEM